MTTPANQAELFKQLSSLENFASSGLVAVMGDRCEIVIERRGHVRGIWHCKNGKFAFTPAGYNEPSVVANTITEAVEFTRKSFITK